MSKKITVATTWLQSCSGCHISLLDLHEELLDVLDLLDIQYSTIVDVKQIPEVDLGIIEGAVCNDDNEEILLEFRKKSKKILALGTCACFGGIPGLRNLYGLDEILDRGYVSTESTVDGRIPRGQEIPRLKEHVKSIGQVISVDYQLPGCPPIPSEIKRAILTIARGEELEVKTKNLCEECSRKKEKMLIPSRDFITDSVVSVSELERIDPHLCFLEQGVLCMGPATREGCGARCLSGNVPCRGCMGPTDGALEQGAKMVNALSSILPAGGLMFNEDVVGVGYRYSMPVSLCPHRLEDGRKSK
jgi:F420-non-reducing hydrogenase small subunit